MQLTTRRTAPLRSGARHHVAGRSRCVLPLAKASVGQAPVARRELLASLGLLGGLIVADGAQAKDAYEELRSITASRTGGSGSLLESFDKTKAAVAGGKADRGIRAKLAAEASNAPKGKVASSNSNSSGFKFGFGGGNNSSGPKPSKLAAPKPAAPKPKPAAAAGAAGGASLPAPLLQAAAVLGFVGLGANAVTSAATSKPKAGAKPAAAAAPAPAPARGTAVVRAASPAPRPAPGTAVKAAGTAVKAKAAGTSRKVAAKAGTADTSGGSVKVAIKQALVNEENPNEPTDVAVGGLLGAAALLAAFLLFGLPKPIPSGPPASSRADDPLVQAAKEAGRGSSSSYATPLFKSLARPEEAAPPAAAAFKTPKQAPALADKPAPAPAPAKPAAAPVVAAPAAPAKPVPAPVKAAAPAAAPAAAEAAPEQGAAPSNLVPVLAGVGVLGAALAFLGNGGDSSSSEASSSSAGAAPAAPAGAPPAEAAAAEALTAAAAASASVAAAATPDAATPDNAAYERAVNALFADPDTADELYSIIAPGLRNAPALAWALVSNTATAETLDGWAWQKLPATKYARVRALLAEGMGLQLPDTPKPQPSNGLLADDAAAGAAADLDPEKLRAVFAALLANPDSRALMARLLAGAGMPFDQASFEAQVRDANYFSLAIAPILRRMPQQKLAVLADLTDPQKLQALVESVSSLAAEQQLDAVATELSSDVRSTVERIRQSEPADAAPAAAPAPEREGSGASSR